MVEQRVNSAVYIKVLTDPMTNPLGINPSKENQGTTRGKEKKKDLGGNQTHNLWIRSTVTLPTKLHVRSLTEKVGDDSGGESWRKERVHMNIAPRSTMNTNGN